MLDRIVFSALAAILCTVLLGACNQTDGQSSEPAAAKAAEQSAGDSPDLELNPENSADTAAARSPGKPTAPVSIEYDVIGNAVVGQPVGINLRIVSRGKAQPVTLHYRVNDSSAMLFPESQAQRIDMPAGAGNGPRQQQVTVIPQREGRLFLNVSAEVETDNGTMFRSLAIPIQVGAGSANPAVNGNLKETAEGEQVISMPASESDGT